MTQENPQAEENEAHEATVSDQPGESDSSIPIGHAAAFEETSAEEATAPKITATDTAARDFTAPLPPHSPDGMGGFFQALSRTGPLLLLVLLAAQVWPGFLGGALYCPPEAQNILVYKQAAQSGQWLATAIGNTMQWPGFTWFLAGLAPALAHVALPLNILFPLAAALSAFLVLLGVWGLSRAAGFGAQAALAAGLILLCSPFFALMPHFIGPDALGAALLLFSLICLCCGLQKERDWLNLPLGCILAALAGLTAGLYHLLLPLLTSLVFAIWTGKIRRVHAMDAIAGFALLLLCIALWTGGLILFTDSGNYAQLLSQQLFVRPWPLPAHWWLPLAVAGAGLVPWLALVICVSWNRVLLSAWSSLRASRKDHAGAAFVWIALIIGIPLSLLSPETCNVALSLLCLAVLLLGKALVRLSTLGSRIFYGITTLCLVAAGLALVAMSFGFSLDLLARACPHALSPEQRDLILSIKALPLFGGICLVSAVLLARFVKLGKPGGALLICVLGVVALAQPATLILAPSLEVLAGAQLLRKVDDIKLPITAEPAQSVEPERKTPGIEPTIQSTEPMTQDAEPTPKNAEPAPDPEPSQPIIVPPSKAAPDDQALKQTSP